MDECRHVEIRSCADLYSLHSTRKIDEILSQEERDKYAIGYDSMAKKTEIEPISNDADKAKWFDEFVKFKEGSKLYAVTDSAMYRAMQRMGSKIIMF